MKEFKAKAQLKSSKHLLVYAVLKLLPKTPQGLPLWNLDFFYIICRVKGYINYGKYKMVFDPDPEEIYLKIKENFTTSEGCCFVKCKIPKRWLGKESRHSRELRWMNMWQILQSKSQILKRFNSNQSEDSENLLAGWVFEGHWSLQWYEALSPKSKVLSQF